MHHVRVARAEPLQIQGPCSVELVKRYDWTGTVSCRSCAGIITPIRRKNYPEGMVKYIIWYSRLGS